MIFIHENEWTWTSRLTGRPRGVTLVELLIVLAVVSVASGLALAAIQRARGAAHRVSCQNNLRQIGLAYQQYFSMTGQFSEDRWTVGILPWIESDTWSGLPPEALEGRTVEVFRCLADSAVTAPRTGNYNHNLLLSGLTLAQVQAEKGLSNTALCGEDRAWRLVPWPWGPQTTEFNVRDTPHGLGGHVLFGDGHATFLLDQEGVHRIMSPEDGG